MIASYECAQKLRGYERTFGMLICDESHMLKSPVSKRTQFFTDLVVSRGSVRRLIFLTGTPVLSRPNEVFTQVRTLLPLSCNHCFFAELACPETPTRVPLSLTLGLLSEPIMLATPRNGWCGHLGVDTLLCKC